MGFFIIKFYGIDSIKFGITLGCYIQDSKNYVLDDLSLLPRNGHVSPENFLAIMNSIHPSILFSIEYSIKHISFFKILIKQSENRIWINL